MKATYSITLVITEIITVPTRALFPLTPRDVLTPVKHCAQFSNWTLMSPDKAPRVMVSQLHSNCSSSVAFNFFIYASFQWLLEVAVSSVLQDATKRPSPLDHKELHTGNQQHSHCYTYTHTHYNGIFSHISSSHCSLLRHNLSVKIKKQRGITTLPWIYKTSERL